MKVKSDSILGRYSQLIGDKEIKNLQKKVKKFENNKILHVNATKFGGGVAEILSNMIPLMRELNLNADWKVFTAPDSFFEISKKMHNALQGNMNISFSDEEISIYLSQAKSTYDQIQPEGDFIIIHDPQPCPVIKFEEKRKGKWIWRCHIDTMNPNPQAWNLISEYLPLYDALIFTKKEYVQEGIQNLIFPITPSIDPFSDKNKDLGDEYAKEIIEKFVPLDKPLITQISRFDPWKDPLGVIDVYRIVKEAIPIRLVLIGSLAHDDPEGQEWLEKVKNYATNDPDVFIFTNLDGVADLEVNAFQRISDIIMQKSIKEGFGMTVTEALWKKTPVIGGNVGGIKLQIEDGINGYLVNSVEEAAEKALFLLKNPKISKEMGKKGHEKVKNQFLLTKHVENYLDLFSALTT
ncbi:MAG: glycosyltransferase [Candidatus Lokiarchaeota archaeon]|nr:glycosyltransferase [Candidatus Lokiarchaeota archaeon]